MNYAVILAGGSGARLSKKSGMSLPKQFLPLGAKTVLEWSVDACLRSECFNYIYVVAPKEYADYADGLLKGRATVLSGGHCRNKSLYNAVCEICMRYGAAENDLLLTHDAARPFLPQRVIKDNLEIAYTHGAAATALPCTDTVFISDGGERVAEVPRRNRMFMAQTPQTFRLNAIERVFSQLTDDESAAYTDAASVFLHAGMPVELVKGDPHLFKITVSDDYDRAKNVAAHITGGQT
jgi:2-C-methyl-D-erythritol 4-phosphate cytidylyltransferase